MPMASEAQQPAVAEPDVKVPAKKPSKREPPRGNRPPRKRTKTGCLTCRKRRIKCGEERPTCFNCHKSRRECEGYRPPIVFRRSQINSSQPELSPATHLGYNGMYIGGYASQYASPAQDDHHISSLPSGWSSTGGTSEQRPAMDPMFFDSLRPHVPQINTELAFNHPFSSPETAGHTGTTFTGGSHWQLPVSRGDSHYLSHGQGAGNNVHGLGLTATGEELLSFLNESSGTSALSNHASYRDPAQSSYSVSRLTSSRAQPFPIIAEGNQDVISSFSPFPYGGGVRGQSEASHLATSDARIPLNDPSNQTRSSFSNHPLARGHDSSHLEPMQATRSSYENPDTSQMLDAAAVQTQDDDYWDLPSDEEGDPVEDKSLFETKSLEQDFDTITALTKRSLALAISNLTGANVYTYPGFSLDEYRPEYTANPLRNPYTQRVFAHFVFSTGPLISYLQQRQRVAPSPTACIGKISSSHQGLWTYTLATMALHNQGLLHAMLAMASLHIAKLQGASTTPSLKHYSYALRRIHRDVQHDRKRHEVSTLAATLLLAFFEIGQADHRKWSTHLVGAKQLISEIDFAHGMAQIKYLKAIRSMESEKLDLNSAKEQPQRRDDLSASEPREATVEELFPELDTRLINKIMGKKCTSDGHGNLVEDFQPYAFSENMTAAELRNYQILQDLFWWNCRHDIIHGLVGGNALLYDYEKWRHCPPRAPIGQLDAVHGSFDHFILLMGRLVHFISSDRARKLRMSNLSNSSSKDQESGQIKPAQGPGFYGMAPSHGPAPLPQAYERRNVRHQGSTDASDCSKKDSASNMELQEATAMAVNEWNDIYMAFTALADALGPAYQPLTDAEHPPISTPFGPAVVFKSHAIAALWAWYYAGLIIAIRSHPTMPAAQTLACGVAAHKTEKYANMVGRITYNITSDFLTPPLDPSSAGAFAESSLPIFFAAVQYRDNAQRQWTIGRLREIESLTGWATIGLCANGCESAWINAHEMGDGPGYEKKVGIYKGEGTVSVMEEQQEQLVQNAMETGQHREDKNDDHMSGSIKSSDQKEASSTQKAEEELSEHERRFTPFYRGTQVMWAYQLYSTTLKDDFDGKFGHLSEFMVR